MKKRLLAILVLLVLAVFALTSCNLFFTPEKPTYKVTFDTDGGSAVESQVITHKETATMPDAPTKEGHTFDGWYADEKCTTAWDFEKNLITSQTTIYAKWNLNSHTVSFVGAETDGQTVGWNTTATKPADPTKVGHTFGGWFADEGFQTAFDFTKPIKGDTTVYAKWNINSYTVSFDVEGVASQTVQFGSLATKPTDPTKTGYTFRGWLLGGVAFDFATPITESISLSANWEINKYTITYTDGVDGETVFEDKVFKDVPYGSATPTITEPIRQGYQFNGWDIDVADTVSGDVTYKANWVIVHEHSYTVKNTSAKYLKTEATCTEPAVYYYSCSQCIAKGSETFQHGAPLGHDMGAWTETKAPTCTETGSEKRDCSRCDHSETRDVAAKGHSYSHVVTAPTCTEDGYTTHTCGDCGHSYKDSTTTKLGHNMGQWTQTKAPTCTDKGTEKRNCTRCSHFETRDVEALKHSFTTYVYNNDATCTADGTETAKCDRCDETHTRTKSGTAGHKYGQLKAGTDATCTSTGTISHYQCSGCNKYFNENKEPVDSITIPKNSQHTSTEFVYVNNNDGTHSKTHKCCGAVVESEKNIPHDWNDWTYEEDEHIRSCKICSATETTDEHIYTSVRHEPTCTENGKIVKTCLCGHIEEEAIPATGHTKDENNVCTECNKLIVETTVGIVIADYADDNNWVDATKYTTIIKGNITITSSGTDGNTGKYYVNGENWRMYQTGSATIVITSNGNAIKSVKITYSNANTGVLISNGSQVKSGDTVTVNGTTVTFSVGNTGTATNGQARITKIEVVYEVVECNGEHDWNEGTVTKEPSCTETGVKHYTCDECGKEMEETLPTASHTATKTDAKAPGCESTGTKAYWQCTECEGYFSDEACTKEIENLAAWLQTEGENGGLVAATGHTEVIDEAVAATCTSKGLTEGKHCDTCGEVLVEQEPTLTIPHVDVNPQDNKCDVCTGTICEHTGGTANCQQGAVCTKCGIEYTLKDATNHVNTTEHQQVNATCTEVGYTAGTYCEDCDKWISGHAEIEAIAHKNKVHHAESPATCNATGTIEYWSCPDCSKNFSDEACLTEATNLTIEKDSTNHVGYNEVVSETAADCTTAGVKVEKCACGDTKTTTTPALGHQYEKSGDECGRCGKIIIVITTKMQYINPGNTATMEGNDVNNATIVGLDSSIFTVLSFKNSNGNQVGLNQDGTIRLYANDCHLTIDLSVGDIISISIDVNQGTPVVYDANGKIIEATSGKYTINGNSFKISNTATSGQVRINSVDITYIMTECNHNFVDGTCDKCGEEEVLNFTVKFVNEDGTVLFEQIYSKGELPEYQGENPEKASTVNHTYTFKGWDKEITAVTSDVTYTAEYTESVRIYESPKDIVDAAYSLALGETLSDGHKYTLTGVITKIDTEYSTQYSNVSVIIAVNGADAEKTILCFRMKGEGADVIAVGDTITVTGVIKNYDKNGTGLVEFDANCTLDSYSKPTTPEPDPEEPTEYKVTINYIDEEMANLLPDEEVVITVTNGKLVLGDYLKEFENYEFDGWYYQGGTEKITATEIEITADITIEARYTAKSSEPEKTTKIEITANNLGLTTSYKDGTASIESIEFGFTQLYKGSGDSIQMRKKNGVMSAIWNNTAFSSAIVKIELVYAQTPADKSKVIFTFGTSASDLTAYTANLSTKAGQTVYTITPDKESYTFFKMAHDCGNTFYWASITIYLADGTTVEPEQPEVHEHDLTATEAKAPTCTEAGNSAYWYCAGCDKYFSDANANAENEIEKDSWVISINKENHTGTVVNGGTAAVHTKYSCCNATFSTEHSYTTEKDGTHHWTKCACGHTTDKVAHTFTGWTQGENDTHTGSCSCGQTKTEDCSGGTATCTSKAVCGTCNTAYGELKAHVYDKETATDTYKATAATCTDKATYYYSCVCGKNEENVNHTFASGDVDVTNHTSEETSYINKDGDTHTKIHVCCNTVIETVAHTFSAWTPAENQQHTRSCVCGKTETADCSDVTTDDNHNCDTCGQTVGGHSYDEGVVTTAPTCTKEGVKTYTCNCGHTYTEDVETDSTNHVHTTDHQQTNATCTEVGYTAGTYCEDCDKWISGHEEIAATGHSVSAWSVVDPSADADERLFEGICNACEETVQVDLQERFSELTYVTFGDSITYGIDGVDWGLMQDPYPELVSNILGFKSFNNLAVSGATFCENTLGRTNMTQKILSFTGEADIISLMLGVNDCYVGLPLGTPESRDNTTIYGSLFLISEYLTSNYEDALIFYMTPFPAKSGYADNSAGYNLEDVANAIKHVAALYDIPVLDMYLYSEYEDAEMNNPDGDGLHPSQSFMRDYAAPKIATFIKELYGLEYKHQHTEVVDEAVEPDCINTGLTEGKHCSVCHKVLVAQTEVAAKGHAYGEASYTWTGVESCTATRACTVCKTHNETANAEIASEATTDPTCTEKGAETYTAEFTENWAEMQTKVVEIPVIPHSYDETKWVNDTENHWHACTACGDKKDVEKHISGGAATEENPEKCTVCGYVITPALGHIHTNHLTATEAKAATCTEAGNTAYWSCDCGKYFSDANAENEIAENSWVVSAKNHAYGEATYTWSEDGKSCTATRVCGNDANHVETAEATIGSSVTTDSTCTAMGTTTYTATFSADWATTQTTTRDDVAMKEHSYSSDWEHDETNHWHECSCGAKSDEAEHSDVTTDDNHSCDTCGRENVTSHSYNSVVTAPTCTEDGYTTYTCNCGDTYTDNTVDKHGHDYNTTGYYVVVEDVVEDVVKRVLKIAHKCANDESHVAYEETPVDTANPVEVATEADLKTVLYAGYSVKLTADIELTKEPIKLTNGQKVTINLNGKTITANWATVEPEDEEEYVVVEVLYISGENTEVTITGEGAMISGDPSVDYSNEAYNYIINSVVSVLEEATLNIKGGYYCSYHIGDVIFAKSGSKVCISGGKFEAKNALAGMYFVLDTYDNGLGDKDTGFFHVTGGEFVNFNPANHNNDGTYKNKVTEGYHSIYNEETKSYTVSEHVFSNEWSSDSDNHWHVCECGATKDVTAHSYDNYNADEGENTHTGTCACGKTHTEDHDYSETLAVGETTHCYECSVCHDKKDEESHSYSNYSADEGENTHTGTCTCGKTHTEDHDYSETLAVGETTHWHECSVCHDKKDEAAHNYNTTNSNDTYHWTKCACGHETEKVAHVYDKTVANETYKATDATCVEAATYYYSCECGKNERNSEHKFTSGRVDPNGHTWTEGKFLCSNDNCEKVEGWELVTNIDDIQINDTIIIAAKDYNYAISTTQNGNNRGQASIVKGDNSLTLGEGVQIIILEAGNVDGTFAFNTGSGYLYAASSGSNYLRTENTLSDNSSWAITIAEDGTATIIAQGSNTRNTMQYNKDNGLFSCYGSASQKAIVIYVKREGDTARPHTHTYTDEVTKPTCTTDGYTTKTCICGDVQTVAGDPATGHSDTLDVIFGACGNEGYYKHYKCKNSGCNQYFEDANGQTKIEDLDSWKSGTGSYTGDHQYDNDDVCTNCGGSKPSEEESWELVDDVNSIAENDIIVIVWTTSKGTYAISNDNGTSEGPSAIKVTISEGKITDGIVDNIKWNIKITDGSLVIYPNGTTETWLYCTSTNNGVRVGKNDAKVFTIDNDSGYLKHTGTSRYLGIYNSQDARCYNSTSTNIANQTLAFYKRITSGGTTEPEQPTTYTVTINYKDEGGNDIEGKTQFSTNVEANTVFDLTNHMTIPGYEFKHWDLGDDITSAMENIEITENVILTAIFTKEAEGGETTEPEHTCDSKCETCGKCTEDACADKCECIILMANGAETGKIVKGDTLPSAGAPDGYTFVGWSKTQVAETTTAPTTIEAGEVYEGEATTLYAVYTRTETVGGSSSFVKVTSAPSDWSGDYLIVYEDGNLAFNGALTTLDAVSNTVAVTISNNTIEATNDMKAAKFTIDKNGYIKSASGYYIGQTSNANGLKYSTSTTYTNTLSINNDGSVNIVSGGAYLRYNISTNNGLRFRYYKSSSYTGQKAICLYKLTEVAGTSTTYYTTNPTN